MADNYDNNGYGGGDFKRNSNQDCGGKDHQQDGEDGGIKLNEKAGEYMRDLLSEKIKIDQAKFPMSSRLIDQEVTKVQASGRVPMKDFKYVDVFREKPVKVTVKVLVPVKEHPKFNFVGKLLGPKGNTMKHLQEETMCKMAVLGRGSMRDRQQEAELRNSLDPKYAHLSDELHVEISALAPPAEAHARIAYALAEVKKYLIPDNNDNPNMMRQPLMRDFMERPPAPRPAPPRPRPPGAKTKVFSILDRARTALDPYPQYDDHYAAPEPPMHYTPKVRVPPRAEPEFYPYERSHDRYYEEEPYYKEDRDFKSAREVGTRRTAGARPFRASPYDRQPK